MPSPIINLHNYPNVYLSTCILFLLLKFSIIVYIFVCSLCFIVTAWNYLFHCANGLTTTRLNKYYYYYYYCYRLVSRTLITATALKQYRLLLSVEVVIA